MKKKFRIIAAALALCLSVLCSPAALAGGYGTAAATPISHSEKPRAASSATHTASVMRRPEKKLLV